MISPEPSGPWTSVIDLSPTSVNAFLAETLEDSEFAQAVALQAGITEIAAAKLLGDLASEARLACRLLATMRPTTDQRIFEVGAGAGVVSAYLHGKGASLFAIEPVVDGFGTFMAVRSQLEKRVAMPTITPIPADELRPSEHGQFDLIFSVNVLEHMHPLDRNLDAIASVLAPGGQMIHTCPNYRMPYEPHYRLPLVPVKPGLTRYIARRVANEPVWRSLNWITAGHVRRFAQRNGLDLQFRQGELAASLRRLRDDPDFARRQKGPIVAVLRGLDRVRLLDLLSRAPAQWLTPMTFALARSVDTAALSRSSLAMDSEPSFEAGTQRQL